jgi:predicted transcriptional regulator
VLARTEVLAKKESRTMSELGREALRHYECRNWWDETNAYGRKTAEAAGIGTEDEVIDAIHAIRQKERAT